MPTSQRRALSFRKVVAHLSTIEHGLSADEVMRVVARQSIATRRTLAVMGSLHLAMARAFALNDFGNVDFDAFERQFAECSPPEAEGSFWALFEFMEKLTADPVPAPVSGPFSDATVRRRVFPCARQSCGGFVSLSFACVHVISECSEINLRV